MTTLMATNHRQVEAVLHETQAAISASLETLVQGHVEFVAPFLSVEDDEDDERQVMRGEGGRKEVEMHMEMEVEVEKKEGEWTDEEEGEVE
jgi:hypothetical protein